MTISPLIGAFFRIFIINKTMNKEQVFGIIRHTLTFAGGILVIKGVADQAIVNEVIGSILSSIGLVWSLIKNKA
jgi:hypothetical protein